MKTRDIKHGDVLAFHPRSITIKNSNGKTCGVVRNIRHFKSLAFKNQVRISTVLRRAKLKNKFDPSFIYESVTGDMIYYFNNTQYNNPLTTCHDNITIINY